MAGLVITNVTGPVNGWEQGNFNDFRITISNNESVAYKLNTVSVNLAKGDGTVYNSSGGLTTGYPGSTVKVYFSVGTSASGTRATDIIEVTNVVTVVKKGTGSENTGYFKPSNTTYRFTFLNPPTVSPGNSITITLCKQLDGSGHDVLSWANRSSTPPSITSVTDKLPGSPTITDPVIEVGASTLVGTSVSPTVTTPSASSTSLTNLIYYDWYRRTYDQNGQVVTNLAYQDGWMYVSSTSAMPGFTPAIPSSLSQTISSTVSKVEFKVISRIVDSRYEVSTKYSNPCIVLSKGKLLPPVIASIVPSTTASAIEVIRCNASQSGNPSSSLIYYKTYFVGSGVNDVLNTDWDASNPSVTISSRPSDDYDSIKFVVKCSNAIYLDSDEVDSNSISINYAPRGMNSGSWTIPSNLWSWTSGDTFTPSQSVTITLPSLSVSHHLGCFNYYRLYFVNNGTETLWIEGYWSNTVTVNFSNYVSISDSYSGAYFKLEACYYAYPEGVIDDVPSGDKGKDKTWKESPTFNIGSSTILVDTYFPDMSLPLSDRVTYNSNPFISFKVSTSDSNDPVRKVVLVDDKGLIFVMDDLDTQMVGTVLYPSSATRSHYLTEVSETGGGKIVAEILNDSTSSNFMVELSSAGSIQEVKIVQIRGFLASGIATDLLTYSFTYVPYNPPVPGDLITAQDYVTLANNYSKAITSHRRHAGLVPKSYPVYSLSDIQGRECSVEDYGLLPGLRTLYQGLVSEDDGGNIYGYLYSLVSRRGSGAYGSYFSNYYTDKYPNQINNSTVVKIYNKSSGVASGKSMILDDNGLANNINYIFGELILFIKNYL